MLHLYIPNCHCSTAFHFISQYVKNNLLFTSCGSFIAIQKWTISLSNIISFCVVGRLQLTRIPDDIQYMESLEVLMLGNNMLRRVPVTIGALQKLRVLDLEENKLDQLPAEIGQLEELTRLVVQSNHLQMLPVSIGKSQLTVLGQGAIGVVFSFFVDAIAKYTSTGYCL